MRPPAVGASAASSMASRSTRPSTAPASAVTTPAPRATITFSPGLRPERSGAHRVKDLVHQRQLARARTRHHGSRACGGQTGWLPLPGSRSARTAAGTLWERLRLATLDVTDEAAAQAAIGLAVEAFGGVDVVVNNAGYGDLGSVEDTSLASFRPADRGQSARHHHRHQGGDPRAAPAAPRAYRAILIRRRTDRSSRTRGLFGRESGASRAFRNRWRARWR